VFGVLFCVILVIGIVSASGDVAYVYRNSRMVDDAFVSAFGDMGLSVDLVDNKNIKTMDFSGYRFVFVGDERLRNLKYLPEDVSVVLANRYYGKELGFLDKGRISKLSANAPLSVEQNPTFQVYDRALYKLGSRGIPYYYIPNKYQKVGAESVARTPIGYKRKAGDVISYLPGKCFFGIVEAEYWTEEAMNLFVDCVEHVLAGGVHDVEIVGDYVNSVGGVRIKDIESGEYLLDSVSRLECNKKYKIDFKTENVGEYTEDVLISGVFGDYNWSSTKSGLGAGATTTINISYEPGFYDIEISAWIEDDATPLNNVVSRGVEIFC